uniref:Uncharacterized protein n=1 Tax=Anguilla anguilla TaxID=7936 RepID=A0A0E9T7A2_ANGAN
MMSIETEREQERDSEQARKERQRGKGRQRIYHIKEEAKKTLHRMSLPSP